jgi:hypothetical protein
MDTVGEFATRAIRPESGGAGARGEVESGAPGTPTRIRRQYQDWNRKPAEGAPPKDAPPQVNEIQKNGATASSQAGAQQNSGTQPASGTQQNSADSKQDSSSKKKSKKGLRKLIPF